MSADAWNAADYRDASSFQTAEGQDLVAVAAARSGEQLLDVGCGDGRVTQLFAHAGARVTGVDASESMVAAARAHGVAVVVGRAEAIPFRDRAFDVVVSNAALHWSVDHEQCIGELVRVLRPGGRLLVRVGGPGNQWRVFSECMRLLAEPPYRSYRPPGFRLPLRMADPPQWMAALLERGMQVDTFDVETAGPGWSEPAQMRRWLGPIAAPCTDLLPDHLAARFLDVVVERTWPLIDPRACFVRLVVSARK